MEAADQHNTLIDDLIADEWDEERFIREHIRASMRRALISCGAVDDEDSATGRTHDDVEKEIEDYWHLVETFYP